jgi:hypothetical protein
MGIYVNPGNAGFAESIHDEYYVDKTGLIGHMNAVLNTRRKEICFTRPRRFGKTTAANMLAAYYSCGCDSRELFRGLEIERDHSFSRHLNRYPVIYFGLISFMTDRTIEQENVVGSIQEKLLRELRAEYRDCGIQGEDSLLDTLLKISEVRGQKFIIIIDEWDMIFREQKDNTALQREYIDFLRMLFRGNEVPQYLAGAYMTGILPIIKYDTQSALSDFREYTMLNPRGYAAYTGFPEDVVASLCEKHGMALREVKSWYDGYELSGLVSVYNPYSVMNALEEGTCHSFWGKRLLPRV